MNESRGEMRNYWEEHSQSASLQEMLLDDDPHVLSNADMKEVLSQLPDIKGKRVLELGAGIGRFTSQLAQEADHVVAVDFMENFILKNEEENGHMGNISFLQADVTKLELAKESFDMVFSNWLLMYLTDDEISCLATNLLLWMQEDGYLYFRESCFRQSGTKKRGSNPTKYRDPSVYTNLFQSVNIPTRQGESYSFELIFAKPNQAYIQHKQNSHQVCWLLQKVRRKSMAYQGYKTFQEFLDSQQYSRAGILRYEKIFGRHFVSTGGKETTEEFVKLLDLKPGQKVLDVGCGIGGSAFYMAENFGAEVIGIDLSTNMVNIALERLEEFKEHKIMFEVADATTKEYPDASFDVVYSRDTILHIEDKVSLFKRFLKCLKPGGKIFITDYCCGEEDWSEEFTKYVGQRGYHLISPRNYGKVLEEAGCVNVRADDATEQFIQVLEREISKTESIKESLIEEFTEADYHYLLNGWKDKIRRCKNGDQKWGAFYAEKKK